MKQGTSIMEAVTLYSVEIEGRGGDSIHTAYFETERDATIASAVDGQNRTPEPVIAYKLPDGSYIEEPKTIHLSKPATKKQIDALKGKLSPALKLLLKIK